MKRLAGTICALAIAISVHAAEEHPIDATLGACMEENPSTAGMIECVDDAYAAWDRELNDAYGALMKRLAPAQKEALRKSQRQWLAWRDAEFESIDALYGSLEGTMFLPMRVDERMQIVKTRALALRGYLDLLAMAE